MNCKNYSKATGGLLKKRPFFAIVEAQDTSGDYKKTQMFEREESSFVSKPMECRSQFTHISWNPGKCPHPGYRKVL